MLTEEAKDRLQYLLSPDLDLHHLGLYISICIIILLLVRRQWCNQWASKEIKYTNPYIIIAIFIFTAWYIYRYIAIQQPFSDVQNMWPDISLVKQLYLWLRHTHLLSLMSHSAVFLFLWHKFRNPMPALFIALFEVGTHEFTFMLYHQLSYGFILQYFWVWYVPFAIIMIPAIITYKWFELSSKNIIYTLSFIIAGTLCHLMVPILGMTNIAVWNPETHHFVTRPELAYKSSTWVAMILIRLSKFVYPIGFFFINIKGINKADYFRYQTDFSSNS